MNKPLISRRAGILLGLLLGAVALAVPVSLLLALPVRVDGSLGCQRDGAPQNSCSAASPGHCGSLLMGLHTSP